MAVVKRKVQIKRMIVVKRKPQAIGGAPTPAIVRKAFEQGKAGELLLERRETEKRKRLISLISDNLGKPKPLSMYEMMLQAGYAQSTALQQSTILVSVREDPVIQDTLVKLKAIRDKMLTRIDATVDKGSAASLAFPLQVVSKEIALLEGRPTERTEHVLPDEERAEILEVLQMNEAPRRRLKK